MTRATLAVLALLALAVPPAAARDWDSYEFTATEIRAVLKKLGLKPTDVLRKKDAAYKKLGLTGTEPAARLVKLMAEYPTLLQRLRCQPQNPSLS